MERNKTSTSAIKCRPKVAIIAGSILFLFIGCDRSKPKFGMEYNEKRQAIGLPQLPAGWVSESRSKDYTIWFNPVRSKQLQESHPIWFSKAVNYNVDGHLISEEDLYYSGKKFTTIDGQIEESLSVAYYFKPTVVGQNEVSGWFCSYSGSGLQMNHEKEHSNGVNSEISNRVTLIQADSILSQWKIPAPVRTTKGAH